MWVEPKSVGEEHPDANAELALLKGELTDEEARITLARFLRHNLKFTTFLLTGIRLAPYQSILINAWFKRNFCLNVLGRGCGKTFSAGVFALLYAIFHPNEHILVVSATFRSSRRILEAIEKLAKSPGGKLLMQTFNPTMGTDGMTRRGDMFTINFSHGAAISAVPLGNSDKLRGLRCSVLILDEGLLIPETTITSILMPFLTAAVNIPEKMKIRQIEDRLIKKGKMKEADRKVFKSAAKLIMLSSASYTFEYLYTMYQSYLKRIDEGTDDGKYFVAQLSYEIVPSELLDKAVIDEMKEMSESMVDREMKAKFTDGSAGYFSAKKMKACTIEDGKEPIVEVVGDRNARYVLAIDPSFSSAEHSDHFAMSVMKIVRKAGSEKDIGMLVHSYAVAGGDLKDHILYLHYLLTNFNIVYLAIDSSQGDNNEFINSCNNSQIFKNAKIELKDIDAEFHKEDMNVLPVQIKKSYNLQDKRIVQKQSFNSYFQRAANEYLQACFDHLNILFAGRVKAIDNATNSLAVGVPEYLVDEKTGHTEFRKEGAYAFVAKQDDLIDLTKNECALIQISSSALGNQSWDLAQSIRRSKNPNRARKDNYSSLLLANWALKLYIESQEAPENQGPPDIDYKLI